MDELRPGQGGVLRLGTSLLRPAHTWGLLAAALGLPLAGLVALLYVGLSSADGAICPALWTALRNALLENPANRLMLGVAAALAPVGIAFVLLEARARIRIAPAGLEADIPRLLGLGLFRQTAGKWRVRWEDVRRVRLVCLSQARHAVHRLSWYRLVIETAEGETWLAVFRWVDRQGPDHRLGISDVLAHRKLDLAARLQDAPLMRAVAARGIPIDTESKAAAPGSSGFDLARHKGMLALVVTFFGAGLYALVDTFVLRPYLLLDPLPAGPFVLAGAAAAIVAWKLGEGAPRLERAVIGVITVAACLAAAHPAMLRLNAATARGQPSSYVSLGEGRFESPDEALPPIDLSELDAAEYWAEYPPGARYELTLIRGWGGFYQLDLGPVYERTRRFYRER